MSYSPSVHRHQDGSLRFYLIFVHSISSCGLTGALYFYIFFGTIVS